MIRAMIVFSLVLYAWHYTYQNFGSFSVHQAVLQSPDMLRFEPVIEPAINAAHEGPASHSALLKAAYQPPKTTPSLWRQWLSALRHGVAISPSFRHEDSTALTLANITPQAITVLIQNELHRTGCFTGKINGIWDSRTAQAIKAFAKYARADFLQASAGPRLESLTVLRQTIGRVCQPPCKTGFTRSPDGTCRPAVRAGRPAEAEDVYARVSDDHPAFLPRRNPYRTETAPLIKAKGTAAMQTAVLDIPLPLRNLRKRKTAQVTY